MDYITTTDLRTESSKLVGALQLGKKVSLIHRSQIVGEIIPVQKKTHTFDLKKFREYIKESSSGDSLSDKQRELLYKRHLKQKYGKGLS